jgi:hypothetical protein
MMYEKVILPSARRPINRAPPPPAMDWNVSKIGAVADTFQTTPPRSLVQAAKGLCLQKDIITMLNLLGLGT